MAETKHYLHSTPNSGYIDAKGKRYVFVRFGNIGRLSTDDASLQAELDAAIAHGAPIRVDGNVTAVIVEQPTTAELAQQALQAANPQQAQTAAQLKAAGIRAQLLEAVAKQPEIKQPEVSEEQ